MKALTLRILQVRQTPMSRVMVMTTTSSTRKNNITVSSLQLRVRLTEYPRYISRYFPVGAITLVLSMIINKFASIVLLTVRGQLFRFWQILTEKLLVHPVQATGTVRLIASSMHVSQLPALDGTVVMAQVWVWIPSKAALMQQLQKAQLDSIDAMGGSTIILNNTPWVWMLEMLNLSVPTTARKLPSSASDTRNCRYEASGMKQNCMVERMLLEGPSSQETSPSSNRVVSIIGCCRQMVIVSQAQVQWRGGTVLQWSRGQFIIQILTAMLHRYTINSSQQGRKSSAGTHKHDSLMYINQLDKCTQILREDRIWLRNQIKNNDEEVLAIFKQAKKPINLQHLQIRLRKHVTAVKSKAKMEQLIKFKQNMHLGDWMKARDEPVKPQPRRDAGQRYQLAAQNQNIPTAARGKNNSSLQKTSKSPMIYPYRNSSAASKRNQTAYPAPMEQITQRESENMTSARHRVFAEDGGSEGMTFSHTYQPWRRPDQSLSSPLASNILNDPFKRKFNETSYFNNFMGEQQSKEPARKQPQTRPIESKQQPQQLEKSDQSNSGTLQFYQNSREQVQQNSISNHSYFEDYSPNAPRQTLQPVQHTSFLDTLALSRQNQDDKPKAHQQYERASPIGRYNQQSLKQPQEESNLLQSKHNSYANNANDSLFTSPQLLAECRNFLKLKSSAKPSIEKDYSNGRHPIDMQTNFQPLKFDTQENSLMKGSFSVHNQTNYMQNIFNEISAEMKVSVRSPHEIFTVESKREEIKQGTYQMPKQMPRIQSWEHQAKQAPRKHQPVMESNPKSELAHSNAAYEYFHTFAGLSSQKKPQAPLNNPEQFVDLVLDNASQSIDGFIQWDLLQRLVYERCPQHMQSFRQYLLPSDQERLVLISNIGRLLEDLMQSAKSPQTENEVRNIYRLLDIEQKGYISEQDIDDFIRQLQDSEAEDIDTISQCLWRLYETIDQDADEGAGKKIDYWGLYSKKTSSEFGDLNEILKQFEFQIE